jgi:FkbM family methyltransferase
LARIDVVKMDVEGAELPALRGFAAGLRTFHPIVACELCGAWTHAFDYEPSAVIG